MAPEGQCYRMASDMEVCVKQRCGIHWDSLIFAECWWRPNCWCERSEVAGGAFQQWRHWQWVTVCWCRFLWMQHATCSLLVKTHSSWWWLCWKIVFCSWEFALSNTITVLLYLLYFHGKKKNGKHFFWSNLPILKCALHLRGFHLWTWKAALQWSEKCFETSTLWSNRIMLNHGCNTKQDKNTLNLANFWSSYSFQTIPAGFTAPELL